MESMATVNGSATEVKRFRSMFNLEVRVPQSLPFGRIEEVREYDLSMRKSALMAYQKPAKRVLDRVREDMTDFVEVGVNTGLLSLYIGGKHPNIAVSGIEENRNLIEVAEENLNLAVWSATAGDVEFEHGKLSQLPFGDKSADIVFSFSSLHSWKRPIETLKECARILKPGGIVFIEDLNRHAEEGHITFVLQFMKEGAPKFMDALRASYTPSEVTALLQEAGLSHWRVYEEDLGLIISSVALED
jgi:ubiquinone/menaquinone biosynthesis C-methylase UbiE